MNYYEDYQLSFYHGNREYISYEQPVSFPFLDLPGELRNKIYRMCLVGPSQYTVNLRFPPRTASSLLCVSKQVFLEASSIFYAENVFRFPATLFTSSSAPNMIEQVCGIRPETLQMMKRFILHIPIHGFQHDDRVRQLTSCNLDSILGFIYQWNGNKLLIRLNYELAWPISLDSVPWSSMISVLRVLKSSHSNIQFEVNVETPWRYLEACMDILVSSIVGRIFCTPANLYQAPTLRSELGDDCRPGPGRVNLATANDAGVGLSLVSRNVPKDARPGRILYRRSQEWQVHFPAREEGRRVYLIE